MSEERIVRHDGQRNFLGGRNMIIGSVSPVMTIAISTALPVAGIAQAGITTLSRYPEDTALADFAIADLSVLSE